MSQAGTSRQQLLHPHSLTGQALLWSLLLAGGAAQAGPATPETAETTPEQPPPSVPGEPNPFDDAFSVGELSILGSYMPVGINIGASFDPEPALLFGAELSVVLVTSGSLSGMGPFFGLYVDALYDYGQEQLRLSWGPELYLGWFGLDGGVLVEPSMDGENRIGGTGRLLLSFVFVHLYGRLGWLEERGRFGEAGLLLKLPFPLGAEGSDW